MDRLNNFFAQGLSLDRFDEILGDLEVHVGLQQCHAHIAQGLRDVAFGNLP